MKNKVLKISLCMLLLVIYSVNILSQRRNFSEWDHTAFCSYTKYHPYKYLKADNNWDIIQELQIPHRRQYLDSIGVKNSDSQMMLLEIEGFIKHKDNTWVSLIPILDSLQTLDVRSFSRRIAHDIYPKIEGSCSSLVSFLKKKGLEENSYAILFSYVLDGEIWEHFNSFEDLKTSATWDGECWALYSPRKFRSGTNGYDKFYVCWSEIQPDFVWNELTQTSFIEPFLKEYKNRGKIVSLEIYTKALRLGLINEDGTLHIPVINSKDNNNQINILSQKIISPIVGYFNDTSVVTDFQEKFRISSVQRKLACTMLYHEVMWDIIDLLIVNKIIKYPTLWENMNKASVNSVVFIRE